MGLNECVSHELFHPCPVIQEKKEDVVAHFKFTVAVRNEGPFIIAGKLLDTSKYESSCKIENKEVLELLAQDIDQFLPNSKKVVKVEKKKDNKAKKAKKREAKEKKLAEEK